MKRLITCLAMALGSVEVAAGVLGDFNLVVLGDVISGTSEVEGRSIVLGDIRSSNTQNYAIFSQSMSDPSTPGVNSSDTLLVGGRIYNNLNVNHGGVRVGGPGAGAAINNADYLNTNDSGVAGIASHVT